MTAVALAVDDNGDGLPEILGAHLTGARVEVAWASPPVDAAGNPFEGGWPFEASDDGLGCSCWAADVAFRMGKRADDPDGTGLLADAAVLASEVIGDVIGSDRVADVLGARLTPAVVELLLGSPPDEVPEPFKTSADGLRWSASAADVARFVSTRERPCSPAPTMVTLGATADGTLLINLERIGLLALEGDPDRAAGVLRRMAFELGAPDLCGAVNVVLVGLPEVSGLEDHVQTAETLGDALNRAASARWWGRDQLVAHGGPSADAARAAGLNGDSWPPSVVLAAGPVTDEDLERAAEVTADPARTAIAVVVATDRAPTPWVVDLTDDLIDIGRPALAIDLNDHREAPTRVLGYNVLEAKAVSSVLETAARTDDVSPSEPPYGQARLRVVPAGESPPPTTWWRR